MAEGEILWQPSDAVWQASHLAHYVQWLSREKRLSFHDYAALWQWSVRDIPAFWQSVWEYFALPQPDELVEIMSSDPMPYTRWFAGARLNYAAHVFKQATDERPALWFAAEDKPLRPISWQTLLQRVAGLQYFFQQIGLQKGDRVAAYLPNTPEATIGWLATVALGAVWSSCSPDFGVQGVLDRFRQIQPKILIAADGYVYQGKRYDRLQQLKSICEALPSLECVILVSRIHDEATWQDIHPRQVGWEDAVAGGSRRAPVSADVQVVEVDFSHPLWILYSSGTTGIPKAITHSHGGMLLEHLKYLAFHNDVHAGENFFWYTTTGWMMWNFLQASLLMGATAVLYDGHPAYPDMGVLWRLAAQVPIHHFGTSAPFLMSCRKVGYKADSQQLATLRSIGSTGSPLPPEGFEYVYQSIKPDVWLCSMSGGTDICTAWVGGCLWRPVRSGEIQCRCLGCSMYAYDENGKALDHEIGEMVVTAPMPCMPVYFWNDPDFTRYRESYFEMYPGVWRHGDWIRITEHDGVIIYGRSDATLNRQGVRIGTAEIYRVLDRLPEIRDSLIVNIELPGGNSYMPLFVVLSSGMELNEGLKQKIREALRNSCSPRHVPDEIIAVDDIPYTISGKKLEMPVKKLFLGMPLERVVQPGVLRNPEALRVFETIAQSWRNRFSGD
ncbi:MAG: acetoacetate--CoA ligase [Thermoflavifilum aggregans]|nr:acetoacetate--CoA ligase [Thermoflavifilum aggregans]